MIIQSRPSNDNYRQNYDGIFKKYLVKRICARCKKVMGMVYWEWDAKETHGECKECLKLRDEEMAEL